MTPRASLLVTVLLASGTPLHALEVGPLDVHGTASQGAIVSRGNNFIEDSRHGTLAFREYGINTTWAATDALTVGGQLFGRDFGSVGNDRLYLDWFNVEYAWRDWLGLRAGKLKVPLGLYGETRDIDSLRTPVLLPQGVYMEYIRSAYNATWGADVHGFIPQGAVGGVSYLVQGGQRSYDVRNGEQARLLAGQGMDVDSTDGAGALAAAFTWFTPLKGLRLATTWSWDESTGEGTARSPRGTARYEVDTHDELAWVLSAEYLRGPLTLSAEVLRGSFDAAFDYDRPGMPSLGYAADYCGGYLQSGWRFSPWFATALGHSYFVFDQTLAFQGIPGQRTTREDQHDTYLSCRFDLTDNLLLKVEEHFVTGISGVFQHENPDGCDDTWSMTLAKATYVF